MPCGATNNVEDVFGNLFNGKYQPIEATINEEGNFDVFIPHTWESWLEKDIPEGVRTVGTVTQRIEVPAIVVCKKYDKIPKVDAGSPSKEKIYERDDYTCAYTGRKLSRRELSIDHVFPTSLGNCPCGCGVSSCWNNMVTCDKRINSLKSDYILGSIPKSILDKMGVRELKLRWEPSKPKYRKIGKNLSAAQRMFVK